MEFLHPGWLWLFGALAVPLLIHLLRRSQYREITFAAAHWLQQQPLHNWKRLQLRDKWLLLLRSLLVVLLALLLAQPVLQTRTGAEDSLLLVDARISRAQAETFIAQQGRFTRVFWLQPEPLPFDRVQPQAAALWPTLSLLAREPQFRRASILLADAQNPTGDRALRTSPHWQWYALNQGHALNREIPRESLTAPRIALLGEAPVWLAPLLQDWRDSGRLQQDLRALDMRQLNAIDSVDWLIYTVPGELPAAVQEFIAAGGLLLSDRQINTDGNIVFTRLNAAHEAAALGRGSWLRHTGDWQKPGFYQRAEFARETWRQWSAQDWALQASERAYWSVDEPPGIPLPDSEVADVTRENPAAKLLLALLLLLSLERLTALYRGGRRD